LSKDTSKDKKKRTQALFYFFKKESPQSTKIKCIREIVKRVDMLNLGMTTENGKFFILTF
jgi:hypothetical protein